MIIRIAALCIIIAFVINYHVADILFNALCITVPIVAVIILIALFLMLIWALIRWLIWIARSIDETVRNV